MADDESRGYETLEQRLGHAFKDPLLCRTALTHKSWLNETAELGRADNERLEFLGDAVLALVVSDLLMRRFPSYPEGELSKIRAAAVNEDGLASVAESIALGQWIFLGRGEEQAGGRHKKSILANTLEALIGAIYVDGGFGPAFQVVESLFSHRLADAETAAERDYKSRLQEISQAEHKVNPTYDVVSESGPEHDKTFEIAISIEGREYARAFGRSKKEAQQAAAARALDLLEAEMTPRR
jgi:ribonuclease-3